MLKKDVIYISNTIITNQRGKMKVQLNEPTEN